MKRQLLPLSLCIMFLSLNAFAQTATTVTPATTAYTVKESLPQPKFGVQVRYWMPELSGNVFVTDDNQTTNVDFKDDLGIDDNRGVPEVRLFFHTSPSSKLRATYLYLDYDGENNLSRTIVYDGQTYPVTTHVESELKVHYFSLGWLWNFIQEDKFKLGLVLDIKGISANGSLEAPAFGFSNSQKFTGAAPVPGLSTEVNIFDHLALCAEITGLPAGGYGHFLDAEGSLKWDITPNWALLGGYRIIDVNVNYKDDSGKMRLKGPFAALTVKF